MKILVVSDEVAPILYDHFNQERFESVEMVISCGDLPADYLEFIISMLNVPCFFVPGNHDESFFTQPPPGWVSLDGRLVEHYGIVMLGFGGSMWYKPGPYQYTELKMRGRYLKVMPTLWWQKQAVDILVTHAPAFELGDMTEFPHRGFKVFRRILDRLKPKFHLHGHVHLSYTGNPRQIIHGKTKIINGFGYHIIDY